MMIPLQELLKLLANYDSVTLTIAFEVDGSTGDFLAVTPVYNDKANGGSQDGFFAIGKLKIVQSKLY